MAHFSHKKKNGNKKHGDSQFFHVRHLNPNEFKKGETLPNQQQNKRRRIEFVEPQNPKNGFGYSNNGFAQSFNSSQSHNNSENKTNKPSFIAAAKDHIPIEGLFSKDLVSKYLKWSKVQRIGPGFYNDGNSCYLNSTLQCLLYIPALSQILVNETRLALKNIQQTQCQLHMKPIGELFTSLVNEVWSPKSLQSSTSGSTQQILKSISPRGMIATIRRVGKQFKPFQQEDAHEYLRQLLDCMHEEVLKANKLKTSDGRKAETTFLSRIFCGYLCNTLTCSLCGYLSETFNHFLDLSLEIRQGVQDVNQAIDLFTKPEQLSQGNEWNCDKCKRKSRVSFLPNLS